MTLPNPSDGQPEPGEHASPADGIDDPDRTQIGTSVGDSLPHSTLPTSKRPEGASFRQVGRYQIREQLGRGAMASVYKAYDPGIDRTLAVKFLHPDLCVDDEHRNRFLREARAAGGLSHPNIVTVYDVGEIKGRPYIAMELLDGATLSEAIKPGEAFPARAVAAIGEQLALALDYAHGKGIFHRDIKPSNIMLLKDGSTIKVADFGIAHMDDADSHQSTRVGTVLGTPQYMSPEQAKGAKVDGRSDLFSAGVVLYHLLTGQLPFRANSLAALANQIANDKPTAVEQLRRDTPPALRRVIERCLHKEPEKRFQTGREMAEALAKVVRALDEEAAAASRSRLIPLRIKWALTMGAVIALTMAATSAVILQRQYSAMMGQVIDYGASLANFLAAENAEQAVLKEWVAVDVSVKDIMETQSFQEISVVDRDGLVQVSSDPRVVGKMYAAHAGSALIERRKDGVAVSRYPTASGSTVIEFEAPITFKRDQGRVQVGTVHLGILEEPLSRVARSSQVSLLLLVVITIAAVMAATYVMASRYFKQIRLLVTSMGELAGGHLDYRIREPRKDEFGEAFQAFDRMADALQQRIEPDAAAQAAQGAASKPGSAA